MGVVSGAYEYDWEAVFDKANGAMLAFACGERDGWDVGDFHEFKSAFKRGGGAYTPA